MHLYDENEAEGQARFFSPAKITRIRERIALAEDAQRQHQLTRQDRKLQIAISKAEKARETEQRKQQRQLARQEAREQLAREKAERQAVREAQRAEKIANATKRRHEIAEHRAQRIRAKEANQASVRSKKRLLEDDGVDQPQKRVRLCASSTRNAGSSRVSSARAGNRTPQHNTQAVLGVERAFNDLDEGTQSEEAISHIVRSGRAIRLPTRFR